MSDEIKHETVRRLDDNGWEVLLRRIKDGRCTPILGAGVYSEGPSLRTAVAKKWAKKYNYPLSDESDLARVARFLAVEVRDAEFPSDQYIEELRNAPPPAFGTQDEPYTILAKLPLPTYITTNYDDFLERALAQQKKDVKTDLCRWMKQLDDEPSPLIDGYQATVANPSVFHLYGYTQNKQSLVLSEDDYFQFLINVSKDSELIPKQIDKAITGTSLILLGYSLDDWDFRVLFHFLAAKLKNSTSRTHVAVQISPLSKEAPEDLRRRAQGFFDKYFESRSPDIRVTWDTTQEFLIKLRDRWEKSEHAA
jgi:hypothetical protein